MSFEIDEAMRAKMRKLRVSTFADIFFGLIADDPQADALPEEVFLAAVDEAYNQRTLRNIAKTITQAKFRYPGAAIAEIIFSPIDSQINIRCSVHDISVAQRNTHSQVVYLQQF